MSMVQEFKSFIMRGNVLDLAVGIVIGAAFTGIVNSLVADIIMPPIGVLMHGIDFSNQFVVLSGTGDFTTLKAAKEAGAVTLNWGLFANQVINFLIVSFAIFMVVKQVNRFKKAEDAAVSSEPPAITPTERLLEDIRDLLKNK